MTFVIGLNGAGMSFRNYAYEHLAQYKVAVLGVQENGLFHYGGRDIPKSHILPIAHRYMNVLERYRAKFWLSKYAKVKLHRYFHHLNSSQALCINLFYPLIAESKLGFFLQFLGIAPEVDLCALFEKESAIEVTARRTSFDFSVLLATGINIFVEVKYTEDGFGRAKNDNEHRVKFRETYLPLVKKSLFLVHACKEEVFFLSHYQVLRYLLHLSATNHVVFLFPFANTIVAEKAIYVRDQLLTDAGRSRFSIVFLEEFVSYLEDKCKGGPLDGYYQAFCAKYLPYLNEPNNC